MKKCLEKALQDFAASQLNENQLAKIKGGDDAGVVEDIIMD